MTRAKGSVAHDPERARRENWMDEHRGKIIKRPKGRQTYEVLGWAPIPQRNMPPRIWPVGVELRPGNTETKQVVSFYEARKMEVVT